MKTKLLSLILAVLMLSSCVLFGCASGTEGSAGDGAGGNATTGVAEDPAEKYDAEIKNLNGHEFRFYAPEATSEHYRGHEIYAEAPNGDKVNDAVFQRNAQLQQIYNCTIVMDGAIGSKVDETLRDPLMAGEYVADIVYGGVTMMINLASANLLVDYNDLENIDLTKVWWDDGFTNGVNVGGKTFMINGSAGTSEDLGGWIMCYNKDYVKEYKSDLDLYQKVREGAWNMDLFYEIFTNTWKDNDGDGVMVIGTDRFGYTGAYQDNWMLLQSNGLTIANYTSSGEIEITDQPKQELMDAWSKLRPVLTSPYRDVSDAPTYVRSGKSTFAISTVGAVVMKAGQSKVNMGILPVPKLYENQADYGSAVYFGLAPAFSIPVTVEHATDYAANGFTSGAEQAAYFLEAFAYYSHVILKPAFYEQVMLKQNATDSESAEMVETALRYKHYDPVAGYRWGSLVNAFYVCGSGDQYAPGTDINYDKLVSYYTARVKGTRKVIENYIEAIYATDIG